MTELPERDRHLTEYMRLLAEADKHLKWLVAADLKDLLPEYITAEAEAAEEVRVRHEALKTPEMHLATIEQQISDVEGRCLEFQAKLTDESPDVRVEAAEDFRKWNHELSQLYRDRDVLEAEIAPLRVAYDQARGKLAIAEEEREAVELNISDFPYWGLGFKTAAYQLWRADMGHLVPILLSGNYAHPEWRAAFLWMDKLCIRSGYRSEGRIPTNAEETKRALENFLHANSTVQPAPGMMEIASQEQLFAANQRQPGSGRAVFPRSVRPDGR